MKFPLFVRRGVLSLVVALSLLVAPVRAQRPAPKPTPAKPVAATQESAAERSPAVTFDTLLSADAYGIYGELRAVGRQANSQEIAQLLTPFKLESDSNELLSLYEFLRTHADTLMTARLMFATMPSRAGLPESVLAIEMPSVEEARKFLPELKQFVAINVAPSPQVEAEITLTSETNSATTLTSETRAATDETNTPRRRARRGTRTQTAAKNAADESRGKQTAAPPFQIKRAGNLIALSNAKFTFKDLHGTDQPLLFNEPGFQAARARFTNDSLFLYFNTVRLTNSAKQRSEALEKEYRRQEELARAEIEKQAATAPGNDINETSGTTNSNANVRRLRNSNSSRTGNMNSTNANVAVSPEDEIPPPPPPTPTPAPKSEKELEEERRREQAERFAQTFGSFVFGGRGNSDAWPESIGVGVSLEAESLVVRGLFVSQSADQPLRPIPFFPALLSGPSISPEAARVLPADTDIYVSASLDLPQMYDYVASLMKIADLATPRGDDADNKNGFSDQLAAFERANNFRIREELLTSLSNEIAVGMPAHQLFGGRSARQKSEDDKAMPPLSGPIVVVALNDKEALQKLLPRVLTAFGFAGLTEQSVLERQGQVEVLTFSNGTLAFIDRFLVGAPDAATMRRITDAYNSGETLANSERFRDPTRWQSRDAVGQLYVANTLLKGMFEETTKYVEDIDDPAIRAYLSRLDPNPGAITLVSTRDTDGLMHELHLPKNLISLFTASDLVNHKLSTIRGNEYTAQWRLRTILTAQESHKEATGRYGTVEELRAGDYLPAEVDSMELNGYQIKLSVSGDRFEATATPTGYPKLGRRSYYIDQTGSLRGADTGGKPATQSNPIID